MTDLKELEKLAALKEKGLLTEKEFNEQKKAILAGDSQVENAQASAELSPKSTTAYVVLAFFFGCLGVHNYYIGRWKQATAQLLLTILSPFTLFAALLANVIWVACNIFSTKTDGKKRVMPENNVLRVVLGIVSLFFSLIFIATCSIGAMAGYTKAMNSYKIGGVLNYTAQVYIFNQIQYQDGVTRDCKDVVALNEELQSLANINCQVVSTKDYTRLSYTGFNKSLMDELEELSSDEAIVTVKGKTVTITMPNAQ